MRGEESESDPAVTWAQVPPNLEEMTPEEQEAWALAFVEAVVRADKPGR